MSLHLLRRFQVIPVLAATVAALWATPGLKGVVGDLYETAISGQPVHFTASADGSPRPTFERFKDAAAMPGATSNTLYIASAKSTSNGVYNVVATNAVGWVMSDDLILSVNSAI